MLHRLIAKASAAQRMLAYRNMLAKAARLAAQGTQGPGIGFFIVSSGRSGSTLLRRMLHAHPAISVPPESEDLLVRCLEAFPLHPADTERTIADQLQVVRSLECMKAWHLDEEQLVNEWRASLAAGSGFPNFHAAIYRSHAASHKPGATLHGDKTPLLVWYLDLLHILYPQARFIFMVRHPLDAIASIAGMAVHHNDLDSATARWIGAADLLLNAEQKNYREQIVAVKYEDLVTATRPTLQKVCDALGVELLPGMVNDIPHDLGDTFLAHHQAVKRPVNREAMGRWKERIPLDRARSIMAQCGDRAERLGYSL